MISAVIYEDNDTRMTLPRWNPPWRGERAYLSKRFQTVHQQEQLVGKMHKCITVRQRTARYPFLHPSALFLWTFFAYFTLALFPCCTFCHVASGVALFHKAVFSSYIFVVLYHVDVAPFCVLYSFHVAPFLMLLHVTLTSCCTFFVLYSFHVALFPCCTFFISHSFQVLLFLCCTLFVLQFSVLQFFPSALFLSSTFFMLCSFRVALFTCCTFFMLESFHDAPFFLLHSFHVVPFVHSFHVALFMCCTIFLLHFFYVTLFSCSALFMLHFFRVVPFSCCTFWFVELLSCCTFSRVASCYTLFVLHFLDIQICNIIEKETLAQVLSCEFSEFSKNTFFTKHPWATASV